MRFRRRKKRTWLEKKTQKGAGGYPTATLGFYGPDNSRASKVAVGIFREPSEEPDEMKRWFSKEGDVRRDPAIGAEITAYLKSHGVQSVVATDRIIGCPHEEGIDYPEGESCPECPYWKGRNRFTGELES